MFARLLFFPLLLGPVVAADDTQAVLLGGQRIAEALEVLGRPLPEGAAVQLKQADSIEKVERILDPLCLMEVTINPESRVKVTKGKAESEPKSAPKRKPRIEPKSEPTSGSKSSSKIAPELVQSWSRLIYPDVAGYIRM